MEKKIGNDMNFESGRMSCPTDGPRSGLTGKFIEQSVIPFIK